MEKLIFGVLAVSLGLGLPLVAATWTAPETPVAAASQPFADMEICEGTAKDSATSAAMTAHAHPLRDVSPDAPAPSVTHLVFPDAVDGYNLQILTQNFDFKPASINREPVANQGHGHLYINGEKIARLYGPWFHIPAALLKPGVNEVRVTLNANDHSVWSREGQPIASSVRVIRTQKTLLSQGTQSE